ncbi:double-stranded RNA-binding protein 1-like isoform X2 [Cornus florida]|uniref:double-stranded RNA-binding protein 1-like isoform X2 n=1 Tax=Cornus florida TaxID=4283 RepID=UPI00289C8962|nr:double-stranded RNA-binding protein 1-like isoform X2 [Cornus florida]
MYKSKLQELCHQQSWNFPEYSASKIGLDHNPRFKATVTVNGIVFETPDQCRSSKEAQNRAAELAFHHFTAPKPLQNSPNKPLCNASIPSSSGFANSLEVKNEAPLEVKNVVQHLYKNRLQNYAQKKNLDLPQYDCEREGLLHASRFKSKVTIDGHTYESSAYFPTDESGLYKNMLQELAQRKGVRLPNYNTTVSGPPHTSIFVSTVEISGQLFQGQEAKNKKQAETNAAKVAYISLQELRATQGSTFPSPDYETKEALKASSSMLQLDTNTGDLLQNVKPEDNLIISKKKDEEDEGRTIQDTTFLSDGYDIKEDLKAFSSILPSIISSGDMPKNDKPKTDLMICDQEDEEDEGYVEVNSHHSPTLPPGAEVTAKRRRSCSSSSDIVYATLRDPFPSISSSSEASSTSSHSSNSECCTSSITNSSIVPSAGKVKGKLPCKKVLIYPRRLNMTISEGATELPISDDNWVALKMD